MPYCRRVVSKVVSPTVFYRLFYNLVAKSHRDRASLAAAKQAAPVFGNDVEPLAAYMIDAHEQPPLSQESLVRLHQLKESAVPTSDISSATEHDVAEASSLTQRIRNTVLTRGMPTHARALLEDARREEAGQRSRDRIPFIHPVVIELTGDGRRISGLTRDISAMGIGLVHGVEIHPQRVKVEARSSNDQMFQLEVEILWSVSCGAGWHFSGGLFR